MVYQLLGFQHLISYCYDCKLKAPANTHFVFRLSGENGKTDFTLSSVASVYLAVLIIGCS